MVQQTTKKGPMKPVTTIIWQPEKTAIKIKYLQILNNTKTPRPNSENH